MTGMEHQVVGTDKPLSVLMPKAQPSASGNGTFTAFMSAQHDVSSAKAGHILQPADMTANTARDFDFLASALAQFVPPLTVSPDIPKAPLLVDAQQLQDTLPAQFNPDLMPQPANTEQPQVEGNQELRLSRMIDARQITPNAFPEFANKLSLAHLSQPDNPAESGSIEAISKTASLGDAPTTQKALFSDPKAMGSAPHYGLAQQNAQSSKRIATLAPSPMHGQNIATTLQAPEPEFGVVKNFKGTVDPDSPIDQKNPVSGIKINPEQYINLNQADSIQDKLQATTADSADTINGDGIRTSGREGTASTNQDMLTIAQRRFVPSAVKQSKSIPLTVTGPPETAQSMNQGTAQVVATSGTQTDDSIVLQAAMQRPLPSKAVGPAAPGFQPLTTKPVSNFNAANFGPHIEPSEMTVKTAPAILLPNPPPHVLSWTTSAYQTDTKQSSALAQPSPASPSPVLPAPQTTIIAHNGKNTIVSWPVDLGKGPNDTTAHKELLPIAQAPPSKQNGQTGTPVPKVTESAADAATKLLADMTLQTKPDPARLDGNPSAVAIHTAGLPTASLAHSHPPLPPNAPVPLPALSKHIVEQAQSGKPSAIELALAPEELGKIRLLLTPDGDKIRVVIHAERPETMDLMRRNTESFMADLRQSGFTNPSFSFANWNDAPKGGSHKKNAENDQTPNAAFAALQPTTPHNIAKIRTGLDLRV